MLEREKTLLALVATVATVREISPVALGVSLSMSLHKISTSSQRQYIQGSKRQAMQS